MIGRPVEQGASLFCAGRKSFSSRGGWQSSGAKARRENDFAYPPPRSAAKRGRGTTRRVVKGACGAEAGREAEAPSTALNAGPPSPLRGAG